MCEDALVTMLDSSMATFFTGSASPRWWWLVTSTWARPASSTGKHASHTSQRQAVRTLPGRPR